MDHLVGVSIIPPWGGMISLESEPSLYPLDIDISNVIDPYVGSTVRESSSKDNRSDEPELIRASRDCLTWGTPFLVEEGVGGTYILSDSNGSPVSIFKPVDEEPGSCNDRKKSLESPLLPPGGGYVRELAAYLLDHGGAGVPETYVLDDVYHEAFVNPNGLVPKIGSIQRFVPNEGNSLSMGSSRYLAQDVHNIGILDIRLFNMDRNGENILVRKEYVNGEEVARLVPIDHTYILPETLENAFFEWLYWKQAKIPFSEETLAYIESIDIDADAAVLRSLGFSEKSIITMVMCTLLLKKFAAFGFTLFDIGLMLCRPKPGQESCLEQMIATVDAWDNSEAKEVSEIFATPHQGFMTLTATPGKRSLIPIFDRVVAEVIEGLEFMRLRADKLARQNIAESTCESG